MPSILKLLKAQHICYWAAAETGASLHIQNFPQMSQAGPHIIITSAEFIKCHTIPNPFCYKEQLKQKFVFWIWKGLILAPPFPKGSFGRSWEHEHFADLDVLRLQQFVWELIIFISTCLEKKYLSFLPPLFFLLSISKSELCGKFLWDITKLIFDLSYADTIFLQTPVKTQTTFLIWIQVTTSFRFGKWILKDEAILWSSQHGWTSQKPGTVITGLLRKRKLALASYSFVSDSHQSFTRKDEGAWLHHY